MSIMTVPSAQDNDKSLITAHKLKKEEEKECIESPPLVVLTTAEVRDYVMNDVLGPLIRAGISRKRKNLPVRIKAPLMRKIYQNLFVDHLLVDEEKIRSLFGEWCRKDFKLGSYATLCGPINITQDVISSTSTNVIIQFHYKVFNGYGTLQWPRLD
jgi:hypothetical protein